MEVFSLFGSVTLDDEDVKQSLEEIDETAEQTEGSVDESLSGMATGFATFSTTALGAVAAVTAALAGLALGAGAVVKSVTSAGDEIDKAAARAGVGAEEFQELRFAAKQNDISQQGLERSLIRVRQELGAGEDASESFKSAIEELNIETENTEDAFSDAITALQQMEDENRKAALAADIFGERMSRQLLPALREGEASFDELRRQAQEAGIVMGEDNVMASAKLQDSLNLAKQVLGTLWREIAFKLLPVFQRFLDWIVDNSGRIVAVFEFIVNVTAIVIRTQIAIAKDSISTLRGLFGPFLKWLAETWRENQESIGKVFARVWNMIERSTETTLDNLRDIFSIFRAAWDGDWEEVWNLTRKIFVRTFDSLKENLEFFIDFMSNFGIDWENTWEKANGIVSAFVDATVEKLTKPVEAVENMVNNIEYWLVEKLDGVADKALAPIRKIESGFEWLQEQVTGNSHIPDMVEDIAAEWDKLQEAWDENGSMTLEQAENDFLELGQLASDDMDDMASDVNDSFREVETGLERLRSDILTGLPTLDLAINVFATSLEKAGYDGVFEMFSTFANEISQLGIFDTIDNIVTPIFDRLSKAGSWVSDKFDDLASSIFDTVSESETLGNISSWVGGQFDILGNAFGALSPIGSTFMALAGESEIFEELMAATNLLLDELVEIAGLLIEPLIPIVGVLIDALMPILPPIAQFLSVIGQLFAVLMQVLAPVIEIIAKVLAPVLSVFATVVGMIANVIVGVFRAVISALNKIPGVNISRPDYVSTSTPDISIDDDLDPGEGADEGREREERGGGQQISEITGPTRDLLTDLLRPLARFDELTGIGNRIYDLLDARLPQMEAGLAGGAGDVNISTINLTVPVDDASQIPRRVVDDLESELATRLLDERRGAGGR